MLFKKPPPLFVLTLVVWSGILFGFREKLGEAEVTRSIYAESFLAPETDLLITGVMDGPLSGGTPKLIELYAVNDIPDLSLYGLGSANNGGGTDGVEIFFSGTAFKGDFLYVASEASGPAAFFGSITLLATGSGAGINGDDAIELFYDETGSFTGSESVIDIFGDINTDGSGEAWDYLDGWAYRNNETGPDKSTFVLANWSFSGVNALDDELTNANAAKPFPIGTYQPASTGGSFDLQITEIWPGQSGADLTEDWFEIYNAGTAAWVSGIDPGLYYDDESANPADATLIEGITDIQPGESVIVSIGAASEVNTFISVWSTDYDLSGIEVGYTVDGAGLGGGGDEVNIWVGDPNASSPVDTESYPDTDANDGQSYDVVNAAFSVDGVGSAAPGTNEANATTLLGGNGPAVGSPGNKGPLVASLELQITEIWPGQAGTDVTEDWFEIYNSGVIAWVSGVDPDLFYDDESADPGDAILIEGITDIQPGESVIVVVGNATEASTFSTVWTPVYNLTGIDIGYADGGSGLGQGGDAVNVWLGTPSVSNTPLANGSYPDAELNSGQSYDLVNGAFSIDGGGAAGAGTNTAAATMVLGGGGNEPAIGSPGNNGPILGAFDLQITEMWPGQAGSDLTEDWFELYNAGTQAWVSGSDPALYYDDESAAIGDAVIISGITDIQPGESVVIIVGDQADANGFSSVWAPDYDLTGIEIGFADGGSGLGGGGDAVNIWVGLPSVSNSPMDTEAYTQADLNDGQSFDVVNAAYSTDGGGAAAPGTNVAAATTALGGGSGTVPAIGSPGNQGPIISTIGDPILIVDVDNLTRFLSLPKETTGSVSGTLNDPTDPAATIGIPFDVEDVETSAANLVVKAISDNASVVPDANLLLSGTDGDRLLTITPIGVGTANITVSVQDADNNTDTYIIQYAASAASVNTSTSRFHTAASDASTAIPIDSDFMWVGDDEDQTIRLYDRNNSGFPLSEIDFNGDLGSTVEIDIEGSFKSGNTIFWMGSHETANRAVIFTTIESGSGSSASLTYGDKYTSLRDDLMASDLNTTFEIEALSLAPGSSTTAYIGFRAPLANGEALIIPVTNFTTLPGASAGSATFGNAFTLDLGGRSLRSMECNANGCILIGGPVGAVTDFKLYTWSGNAADAPEARTADLTALQTAGSFETIVELPAGSFLGSAGDNLQIQLLVDNGTTDYYATGQEAKDLRDEWKKFRSEIVTLGAVEGIVVAANPLINEFVVDHISTDDMEFVEILGDPSTDYSAYTLLQIEGEGSGAGTIDTAIPLGTTDANGYWTTGFLNNEFENGTLTLLVVSDFTGNDGDDLDTDNDGTLDITPWTAIADGVGKNDNAAEFVYAGVPNIAPGFDGVSFEIGGGSRIPNGTDTDAVSDWVRNDFDKAGFAGETGSPDVGEALNTPGADNELVTPPSAANPLINEFVVDHTGTDDMEFVEILGDPSTDYSAYTLLQIEGEGSGAGTIDTAIPLGTTDANGYWTTGFLNNEFENGTLTLLVVSDFTGNDGDDLDTDNDGTLDITPWTAIADGVGKNDNAAEFVYAGVPNIAPGFDGVSFELGGGSRIPNGTDTDAVSDWVRNDFDKAGFAGETGSPDVGEALNTPGADNELVSDQPPIIVTLTPPNGATDVDVATNLIAEFNEDIQAGTGNIQLFILVGDILVESFDVSTSPLVSIVGNTLTIDPTLDLDPAQTYYVTLDAGVVEDLSNNDFAGFADNTFWSFTTDDGLISFVGQCPSFVESFESAPGTSYTLSAPFDDGGFDFFNRYAVPDNGNAARDDFQAGWTGSFGILSQDNDGDGGAATQTITIGPIDISGASSPVGITGSFGALNGEPEFDNYEGGDGIQIFTDIEGTRTLIGAFAPDASGAGDLYQDTDLDGTGDGVNLTTTLTSFSFAAPSTGTSLTLEIELTSNASFEPLAVDNIRVDCESPAPVETKIHLVQGSGSAVTNPGGSVTVEGVVVGDYQGSNELRGFFLQEETADEDGDPSTSEGIFVYCGSCTDAVSEGQIVQVTGRQGESGGMSQIDISLFGGSLIVTNAGDNSGLVSPASVDMPASMSTEEEATFENVEGMLVQFSDELTVTEYFQMGRFGQIVLSEGGKLRQFTNDNMPDAAGFTAAQDETARRRIILDDLNNTENNTDPVYHPQPNGFAVDNFIRGGYTISNLTGVMDYASPGSGDATWRIRPQIGNPVSFNADNPRTAAPESVGGTLKVASFNVLNYFTTIDESGNNCGPNGDGCRGANSAAELLRQRDKIVAALEIIDADVVGLIELENNPAAGPANDGIDPVLEDLVNALNAKVGAGTYDFIDAGVIGTDVIKVAFIYKPATVSPTGAAAILDASVDPRFDSDFNRPALAQTFTEVSSGEQFTPIVNHFKSKGSGCGAGDDDTTTGQGNCNGKRTEAAEALVDWLATDPTSSGSDNFLIIGDLNAYALEDPIKAILAGADDTQSTADDYTDLVNQFVGDEAYSFVFSGQFGYLDHALATGDLLDKVTGTTIWHINSDEVNLLDYNDPIQDGSEEFFEAKPVINELYDDSPYRSSDHDPVIVGLQLLPAPECLISAISLSNESGCDDNETEDPSDDFFTADISVSFENAPTTGTLEVIGDGVASVEVENLDSPTRHTFIGIMLPADGGEVSLTASFSEEGSCTLSEPLAGTAPASCSEQVCNNTNLALGKPTQTPCDYGFSNSGIGVDGIKEGTTPWTANPDIVHVCQDFENDWWQVDLGDGVTDETFKVSEICIYNRSSNSTYIVNRLKEYYLLISCTPFDEGASLEELLSDPNIYSQYVEEPAAFPSCIQIPEVVGQYVRIQKMGDQPLHFAELEVYGCPFEAECGPQPDPCAQLMQPEIVPAGPFLSSDAPKQLMAMPTGGTWMGPGVDINGVFDPSLGSGTYAIAYTVVEGECEKSAMIEIEVLDPSACTPTNLALGKDAEQSSTYGNGVASIAVDGDLDGSRGPWAFASIQHTQTEPMPWWKVDLGENSDIESIKLFNRTDCCSNRLKDFYLLVSENPINADQSLGDLLADPSIKNYFHPGTMGTQKSIDWMVQGRYVAVKLTGSGPLHMAEVEVMGCPTGGQTDCVFEQPTIAGIAPSDCESNDGKIEVIGVSGTDYEYSLDPVEGWQVPAGLLTFFGLEAGTYTMYIRDRAKPECVKEELVEVIPEGGCSALPCTSPENLAPQGVASQSSTYGNGEADFAIDENLIGTSPWSANLQHTQTEAQPWWMVDLGAIASIEEVKIHNRSNGFQNRLKDFYVFVSESPIDGNQLLSDLDSNPMVSSFYFEGAAGPMESFEVGGISGQYVLIKLSGTNPLHLAEVEVYGCINDISGSRFAGANSGIDEESLISLQAYPNPFQDAFTLKVTGELGEPGRLQLVNALGQIIEERQVRGNEDISLGQGLAKGIYFVQLREGEKVHQLKVVKLR